MRYLLIALMIVLLPARGWVGHAMAMDMAAQQVIMAQTAVSAELDTMPEDCPMHAQAADRMDKPAETAGTHCNSCDTCELCLALASFSWADGPAHTFAPQAGPLAHGSRFSSADSVPGIKPPIS
ncbi:hypothetical protein [Polaromonas sp. SM01]|uniref:hypothetical protein n=1 Tax=Polaromonas sp. SM01 TaxID=3085630 RepID=UPI002981B826|nr:hypothetical protein [Polaromonas sp. SM01]MDW5443510.1 hypothetical protein [Polaromonas sp. SM01]